MKKEICILLTVITMLIGLAGCGSSADSFENHVKNGDYIKAIEFYQKEFAGNSGSENTAKAFLQNYLEESWSNYVAGTITEQDFINAYTTLEKLDGELSLLSNLDKVYQQYTFIKKSKESYAQGIALIDSGSLEEAIEAFSYVLPDDVENYENAQVKQKEAITRYQENVITNAEQLADAGDFEEAVANVRAAEQVVGATTELEGCLSDLYTRKYEDSIEKAFSSSDYLAVIRVYTEALTNSYVVISSDMTSKYSSSQTTYLNAVFSKAGTAFGDNKNYTEAIQVLREAMSEANGIADLTSELELKLEYYKEYIPVYVTSLEYAEISKYMGIGSHQEATDVNGKKYDAETIIYQDYESTGFWSREEDVCVTYNLNFKYSTLTGVIYRPYSTVSRSDLYYDEAKVEIYGDDILLYKAPAVSKDTYDPITFTIDVSGVRNLRIVVEGSWYESDIWSAEHPMICLAEVTLQK